MCPDHTYKLMFTGLHSCDLEKDIGVLIVIYGDLSFNKHVGTKLNMANAMFKVVSTNFQYLELRTFIPLYKALVRTHLGLCKLCV